MSRKGTPWGFTANEKRALLILCFALLVGSTYRMIQRRSVGDPVRLTRADSAAIAAIRGDSESGSKLILQTVTTDSEKIESAIIDINLASAALLETLPGIGPVLAGRIIDYRNSHGGFQTVDELIEVSGIGPKKLETVREKVVCGPLAESK